ncbi:MAG: AI-2E family transporter [bacterium]|nr:AI-2E family transporter [bacterium]
MNLKKKMNRQYMTISAYVIVTCIIIYSLSLVAKNAPVIYYKVLNSLGSILAIIKPILIGFAIAYVLDGVVSWIENKLKRVKYINRLKSTRGLAVLITTLLVLAGFTLIITLLVYSVTDQIRVANFDSLVTLAEDTAASLTNFSKTLTNKLNSWNIQSNEISNVVKTISDYAMNIGTNFVSGVMNSLSNVTGTLTTLAFSVIIAIYFLIDGKMIKEVVGKVSYALFSDRANKGMKRFLGDADQVFSGYLKGTLMDVGVMMVLISVTLSIVGVNFAVIIGILAGLGNLIPYCGPFIAYGLSAIVCLVNGDITKMIIAIIALIVIQFIDGNVIGPKLLSQSIEVHPLLVIICLIVGSSVGGLLGMLFAVPVGALIKVIFMRFIDNRIQMKEAIKKYHSSDDSDLD